MADHSDITSPVKIKNVYLAVAFSNDFKLKKGF